ncbi:MAG TPA: hypothetical protein VMX12_03555 [Acidimicrobiia bacterium]|nr:hypothetical protein [Acidimicrobiia bacterium]
MTAKKSATLTDTAKNLLDQLTDDEDAIRNAELTAAMKAYDREAGGEVTADGFWDFMDSLDVTDLDNLVVESVADDITDGIGDGWPVPENTGEWTELAVHCGATHGRVGPAVEMAKRLHRAGC